MRFATLATAAVLLAGCAAMADEAKVDCPIQSVAMFKNGLAIVHRTVAITGAGVYRIEDVPTPVHGTFWIDGNIPVDVQSTSREVDAPVTTPGDPQQELVGKQVTIHFKQAGVPVTTGRVVQLAKASGDAAWNRVYEQPQYNLAYGGVLALSGRMLVLDTTGGRVYADSSEIAFMEVENAGATVRQRRGVLLFTATGNARGTIQISYLTKGIAWAPGYRVELRDDKTLTLKQQAVVKNELADIKDAELSVISGYPSIRFAGVVSPLSQTQTWADFFAQLSAAPSEIGGVGSNNLVMAQQAGNSAGPSGGDIPAAPVGEGVDLHYESIGKRTMAEGDSLMVPVAQGDATYERIVEWTVADRRNEFGALQRQNEYQPRQIDGMEDEDQPWDAVKFKNPLPFAMTTGAAMILDNGRFAGQRMSFWVNSGEETTLHITKALSIRTHAEEQESQDPDRALIYIGGNQYRKVSVKGELTVNNHRKEDVNLVIRRRFSGDLVKADENPKLTLREEGVYSVNRRGELLWTIPLKSGEEKKLTYEYTVLVSN